MSTLLKNILVSVLFGFSLASIPPYPYPNAELIWLVSTGLFLVLFYLVGSEGFKKFWFRFGVLTFICFAVVFSWFWYLAMPYGVWYPIDFLPIIQQFYRVDGESAYDAWVSNLFITVWVFATLALVVWHLTSSSKGSATADPL